MDIARQYRERQADGQKGSEVEDNDRDDFQVQPQAAICGVGAYIRHDISLFWQQR
ncbi:hypothetical protein BN130_2676 [Cronobacter malonaticus 507]|nr:hypothetical protein BN130_2676 [Cronobacter malonaticus 507]